MSALQVVLVFLCIGLLAECVERASKKAWERFRRRGGGGA